MLKPKKSLENLIPYEVPLFDKEWDVKIDANENLYGPSDKVLQSIRNIEPKDIQFYPVYGEISQKIADFCGYDIDNIKVTNGADEAIYGIFQAYLDEGDIVLTVKPTFAMPIIYSKILGAGLIEIPYSEKWVFPIEEFEKNLKNKSVKIVHLTTPNNPTGDIIDENSIKRILESAKDKVVLIDETYGNYCASSYKNLVKAYDNVFIVKSFSKDFGIAGLRLGYVISNPDNIKVLKSVVSPYSVNSIAMKAGVAALDDYDYFLKIKQLINQSKDVLTKTFESLGAIVYPSSSNFLCVEFPKYCEFVYKILKDNNILVKKFTNSEMLKNTLRITAPRLEDAIRISDILKQRDTLVFDMDGVLIDASNSYHKAIKQTFEFFAHKELAQNEINEVKNLGGYNNDWDLTHYLLTKHNVAVSMDDVIEKFQSLYWDSGNGLICDENFIADKNLLKSLSKNYNLAIFTGRPRNEAYYALEKNGIAELFYPVITMDDLPEDEQKPHISGMDRIKNSICSNRFYYFGDTVDDMICGKNSSVITVGVLPPQDKSEEVLINLKKHGANDILDNINDILKILEKDYEMQFKD